MKTLTVFVLVALFSNLVLAEIPVRSTRSVRQQFESYKELLNKEILFYKEKDKKQSFVLLSQAIDQMKTLRLEIDSSDSAEVAEMDTLIAALDSLPSKKKFKKKNCAEYEMQLPQDPAAKPAVDFLQNLCN